MNNKDIIKEKKKLIIEEIKSLYKNIDYFSFYNSLYTTENVIEIYTDNEFEIIKSYMYTYILFQYNFEFIYTSNETKYVLLKRDLLHYNIKNNELIVENISLISEDNINYTVASNLKYDEEIPLLELFYYKKLLKNNIKLKNNFKQLTLLQRIWKTLKSNFN